MACVVCFFADTKQKQLKKACSGIRRYEDKILKYRDIYLDGITKLDSVSICKCSRHITNGTYVKWTDDFLSNLKNNIIAVRNTFDELIAIYVEFISKNQKNALDHLWEFIEQHQLNNGTAHSTFFSRLLFRARPKGTFDVKNIYNLFHISFEERNLIGSQRFSISGQPMVYFASSLLATEKELNCEVKDLALSAYLPHYAIYYNKRIYELTNSLDDIINKALPGICIDGCKIDYYDTYFSINNTSIVNDLDKSILFQLCTVPTENKDKFVPEYVIPQMLTSALLNNGYDGLIFPSTKDYALLADNHDFSSHHINLGLYVKYNPNGPYDEFLLNSFMYFTLDGSEKFSFKVDDIYRKMDSIKLKKRGSTPPNNNYLIPLSLSRLHLEYLENSKYNGQNYFLTMFGKAELEFYMKMLVELESRIT